MFLFLVGHYFYQKNHEKLKLLSTCMKVVSQGRCDFLPLPVAKFEVTRGWLLPVGPHKALQRAAAWRLRVERELPQFSLTLGREIHHQASFFQDAAGYRVESYCPILPRIINGEGCHREGSSEICTGPHGSLRRARETLLSGVLDFVT